MSFIPKRLKEFDFVRLFNELGWDQLTVGLEAEVGGHVYSLQPVAKKKGVQVLECLPGTDGNIPAYAIRQKIERKVTADAREHLIIFTDAAQTRQIWQWVARAPGRPTQYREVKWQQGQATELLEQKLKAIAFDLNEEESLTVFGVAERLRGGFDRDNVTKKFYRVFQAQREAFQRFIEGIPTDDHARWYTAVVIDRLMFLWFLQEKYFLDNDKRYLRNRLDTHCTAASGMSFYKAFLCPLFFRGFAEERTETNRAAIQAEFGNVPYLNGGLFAEHELEREHGEAIDIPDAAFAALFQFFDEWDWHLDERPLATGKEINPDVLGYIFEKFVNQKQMGAYYTKEDITEYIAKNTIIPCLFDKVRREHAAAFDAHVWPLLQEDPRRYLYPAMLHGVDEEYPEEIAVGIDTGAPNLLERRKSWNKPAAPSHALPTEIWRETIARHQRTREVLAKLAAGEVRTVSDLITYNLNIRQFAQDVIERCTDPALLRAFWVALAGRLPRKSNEKFRHGLSVLDPTCGSGAFLFAALQILKPLYQACLTAMSGLLADEAIHGRPLGDKWKDIEETVERFHAGGTDRQCDYAVLKHIIVHNLYGVDIEAQATEIAKLRLFLKLVALLEPGDEIEPLPDIDFNIRAGNTLVGYASAAETERAVMGAEQQNLFTSAWDDIRIRLAAVEQAYNNFQIQQVQRGGHVTPEDKQALRDQLAELEETLNGHLCREYGKNPKKPKEYKAWKTSHKPFHWYVDFYPIMSTGGFDVVIGNPPYLEFKEIDYNFRGYVTLDSGAVHVVCMERSNNLLRENGCMSMIVPLALVSTQRMKSIQRILEEGRNAWYANFAWRPAKLFDTVNRALTIFVVAPSSKSSVYSTGYTKWTSDTRDDLIPCIAYSRVPDSRPAFWIPKLSNSLELSLLLKLMNGNKPTIQFMSKNGAKVYYRTTGGLYWKVFTDFAPRFVLNGLPGSSSRETHFYSSVRYVKPLVALLSSNTFWWWYTVTSNLRDLNPSDIQNFPIPEAALSDSRLKQLGNSYLEDLGRNSSMLVREQKKTGRTETQSFKIQKSKAIIDDIDRALAPHYGFSEEELDYIINYDIKYRMGLADGEADADE
uniref:site-specific DNA-methyltransferase (adenine-specific) n=1 Tax=Geobacter metallireducens TaxID=28232 RepID=A0A831TYN9_GEOME